MCSDRPERMPEAAQEASLGAEHRGGQSGTGDPVRRPRRAADAAYSGRGPGAGRSGPGRVARLRPRRTARSYVETVRAFVRADGSWQHASARVHVRKQTLGYRLRKVEEMTGRGFARTQHLAEWWFALQALDLLAGGRRELALTARGLILAWARLIPAATKKPGPRDRAASRCFAGQGSR